MLNPLAFDLFYNKDCGSSVSTAKSFTAGSMSYIMGGCMSCYSLHAG